MTTPEPTALPMLAAWLRPVLPTVDDEAIETSRSWVVALADSEDVTIEELALAAFGHASEELSGTLEAKLSAAAATYAPDGKTELISHLAAASLLHLLDDRGALAVAIMCRCESLLFLGWSPVIDDLPKRIRRFADEHARSSRSRVPLDPTVKAPRKKATDGAADEDPVAKLGADLADAQAYLGRAVDRIETVVSEFNSRLELIDEEVDALWWARSDRSMTTGTRWADLTTLQRAVQAGIEMTAIVGPHPPTAGTVTVMNQVIGTSDEAFELIEVIAALRESGWVGRTATTDENAAFYPLSFGIASMAKFDDDTSIIEKLLKTTLFAPVGHKVAARAVAQQILNEHALQDDDD